MKAALTSALLLLSTACTPSYTWEGVDVSSGSALTLSPGAMPKGGSFDGRWRSPQLGALRISQSGANVTGRYVFQRGRCQVQGSLSGRADGSLLTFRWQEDHHDCGRSQPLEGEGYFLYAPRKSDGTPTLYGRWGYAYSDRAGGAWLATRVSR